VKLSWGAKTSRLLARLGLAPPSTPKQLPSEKKLFQYIRDNHSYIKQIYIEDIKKTSRKYKK
jgi:hypothetical protein